MFFLIKLITIFIGSGLITYFAYLVFKETSRVTKQFLNPGQNNTLNENLTLLKSTEISSRSAFYEVLFPNNQLVKLFSSHKGMKIID